MDNMSKPAAPCIEEQQHPGAGTQFFYSHGLTKLEYAAVRIAAGMWSNHELVNNHDDDSIGRLNNAAVVAARALFAELEKGE